MMQYGFVLHRINFILCNTLNENIMYAKNGFREKSKLMLLTSIVILGLGFSQDIFAEDEIDEIPIIYQVQVTLVDVGDIDLKRTSYHLRLLVELESDDVDFTAMENLPTIDFVNGDIDKELLIEDLQPNYYSFEVDGEFFGLMDFHQYPYGSLDLVIMIEIDDMPADQAKLSSKLYDPQSLKTGKQIPGWILVGQSDTTQEISDEGGEVNSRYTATFNLQRPVLSTFLTNFLPILVILSIVLYSFYQDPFTGNAETASLGSLLTLVFLHVGFLGVDLPPLEYLTMQGKILTVGYFILVYPLFSNLFQRRYNPEEDKNKNLKINRKMLKILPVAVVVMFLILNMF